MNKRAQTKLLNKAYRYNLKKLNKNFFDNKDTGLYLFVEYLKYVRDSSFISGTIPPDSLAAISTAIAEFNAYKNYKNISTKSFHWNNFCELIKQNMEEWLATYDSI